MMTESTTEVDPTPGRAAFLCNGTADFHPPHWACEPIEANVHARLEAFRDSRHCATYMISTKKVNVFGRDQESCDHVLGNPSVSRKHAAIIHDVSGGIYIVDLMSRHGTFIGKKKIPPHDPVLLHEGDIIKFGQSIRVYILKGASPESLSAGVKKSWPRMKLKAPRVSITSVLPKMPTKPRHSAKIIKLVSDVCCGTMAEEKVDAFLQAVMELEDEERKEVADLLVDKIQAKYRNAYTITIALLKHNLCVEELEQNLSTITHISQQRYETTYRKDARKILQLMAAVRLDPTNVHSPQGGSYSHNDSDSVVSGDDTSAYAPPAPATTMNQHQRDRVLSDEGKRLFLQGVGTIQNETTPGATMEHLEHEEDYTPPNYEPPTTQWRPSYQQQKLTFSGTTMSESAIAAAEQYPHQERSGSGFSFMSRTSTEPDAEEADEEEETFKPAASAFGFISQTPVDEEEEASAPSGSGFAFMAKLSSPSIRIHDFLAPAPSLDEADFEELWDNTTESEEWTTELLPPFDLMAFESCLHASQIAILSSEKVGGIHQLRCVAEQSSNQTVFLIEIMLLPGLSEMTMTLKWVVASLLYENGHQVFLQLFQHAVQGFCNPQEVDAYDHHEQQQPMPSIRDALVDNPAIEPAKFEQLWINGTVIGTLSIGLNDVPEKEDVIDLFEGNCLTCVASGSVNHVFKFFFFAESTTLQCFFCIEMVIDAQHCAVSGTLKRFTLSAEEAEHVDASFVQYFEELVQAL